MVLCRAASKATLVTSHTSVHLDETMTPPANAVMLAVWKDIEGYLKFLDVSRIAGVSRRVRSAAVLGGGRQDQDNDNSPSSHHLSLYPSTLPGF